MRALAPQLSVPGTIVKEIWRFLLAGILAEKGSNPCLGSRRKSEIF